MGTVETINFVIMILFFVCYSYQFFYILVSWRGRPGPAGEETPQTHRIAVLISARNEAAVIGNLLDSIQAQDYPADQLGVFVVADNCTDDTAAIAKAHGAQVFERRDLVHVGKGYALQFLLERMPKGYDAYLVLDADNILAPEFVTQINRTFSQGYEIVTSYRNSKNYGDNWISAGYALWFLREARYLNAPRMRLGSSCAVSGTGFLFSDRVLQRLGGWSFFLLTEDIEFTIANVVRGEKVGYCPDAVLYDEQPVRFSQSWRQRLRWVRGNMQVFCRYGGELIRGIFKGSFSCYDMIMNVMPAAVLTGVSVAVNLGAAVANFVSGGAWTTLGVSVLQTLASLYLTFFVMGAITTLTEWRQIHCSTGKKLRYAFTFPLFMFTYVPICITALFVKPEWRPIQHNRCLSLKQITEQT